MFWHNLLPTFNIEQMSRTENIYSLPGNIEQKSSQESGRIILPYIRQESSQEVRHNLFPTWKYRAEAKPGGWAEFISYLGILSRTADIRLGKLTSYLGILTARAWAEYVLLFGTDPDRNGHLRKPPGVELIPCR